MPQQRLQVIPFDVFMQAVHVSQQERRHARKWRKCTSRSGRRARTQDAAWGISQPADAPYTPGAASPTPSHFTVPSTPVVRHPVAQAQPEPVAIPAWVCAGILVVQCLVCGILLLCGVNPYQISLNLFIHGLSTSLATCFCDEETTPFDLLIISYILFVLVMLPCSIIGTFF